MPRSQLATSEKASQGSQGRAPIYVCFFRSQISVAVQEQFMIECPLCILSKMLREMNPVSRLRASFSELRT
eukprot:s471_g16.t1